MKKHISITGAERQRRYRLRLKDAKVAKLKPGPRKGFKQSPEHIKKRKRFGADHPNWKGNKITVKGGRTRAIRLYPQVGPCIVCGNKKSERHHIDENTANNAPINIIILCRKCHMRADGRLEQFRKLALANQIKAVSAAAKIRRSITRCPKGHPYLGHNLYINPKGARSCRQCLNDYKRAKRLASRRN